MKRGGLMGVRHGREGRRLRAGRSPFRTPFRSKPRILAVGGGLILAADLVTKWLVQEHFYLGRSVDVVGDLLRLTYIVNPGAAFGINVGEYSRMIFLGLSGLAVVILTGMFRSTPSTKRLRLHAIALVVGGAVGNLVDRIRSPMGVVDFLDVGLGSFRWPVFNVADIGVTMGAVLLALSLLRDDRELSGSRRMEEISTTVPEGDAPAPESPP